MENGQHYVSIICREVSDTERRLQIICERFPWINGMKIRGNELLIPIGNGLRCSLNDIRTAVKPARIDLFSFELDDTGQQARYWYCMH